MKFEAYEVTKIGELADRTRVYPCQFLADSSK
jgi:hypothetical protein